MTPIAPTITPREASMHPWDAVVAGAGPAGGMTSLLLARRGWRVLLVEKSRFPREKVCGCCLGAAGVAHLKHHGLSHVLAGATPLREVEIRRGGRQLRLPLTGGVALTRSELDARLALAAVGAGASFIPACHAKLGPPAEHWREIDLQYDQLRATVRSRLVVACDGIRGTLLDGEAGCAWQIARDAWMGAALTLEEPLVEPGRIVMHAGDDGYVGAVALPGGRTHLAAAFRPSAAKDSGGPAKLMSQILLQSGTTADIGAADVSGTGLLTRRRARYGATRILTVGDACCYIEPFTGEGMTWAIRSASLLSEFLHVPPEAWPEDTAARWQSTLDGALGRERLVCRSLRYILHRPLLASAAIRLGIILPQTADALVRIISGSPTPEISA